MMYTSLTLTSGSYSYITSHFSYLIQWSLEERETSIKICRTILKGAEFLRNISIVSNHPCQHIQDQIQRQIIQTKRFNSACWQAGDYSFFSFSSHMTLIFVSQELQHIELTCYQSSCIHVINAI